MACVPVSLTEYDSGLLVPVDMGTPAVGRNFLRDTVKHLPVGVQQLGNAWNFDTTALHGIKDIEAVSGSVRCVLPVEQSLCTRAGELQAGCIGALVDHSFALL